MRPTKRGNRRYYCSEDVALIRTIQHLLYEEHYTILGARNKIHELQIQDKVKETGILDAHTSAPLQTKPKAPEVDLGAILAELKAIRAVLTTAPSVAEKARQERLAKEEAERHAVENFALVSQDLNAMMAAEEAKIQEKEVVAVQEEIHVAPLSYDLGALGAESEDFLTPSPMIGKMTIGQTVVEEVKPEPTPVEEDDPCPFDVPVSTETIPVEESIVENAVEETAALQEPKPVEKVTVEERKPQLVVPPLPGQQKAFTIGMRVQTQKGPSSLIHSSPVYWKK